MANHKSAQKRTRQANQRRTRNKAVQSETRASVKSVRQALEAGDASLAAQRLRVAERALRRAGTKGVVPERRVDRSVSRLARAVHRLAASGPDAS